MSYFCKQSFKERKKFNVSEFTQNGEASIKFLSLYFLCLVKFFFKNKMSIGSIKCIVFV